MGANATRTLTDCGNVILQFTKRSKRAIDVASLSHKSQICLLRPGNINIFPGRINSKITHNKCHLTACRIHVSDASSHVNCAESQFRSEERRVGKECRSRW